MDECGESSVDSVLGPRGTWGRRSFAPAGPGWKPRRERRVRHFATGSFGVLTEGGGFEPDEAPLAVTTNGGDSWGYLGDPTSPRPGLPLLPGHWWPATVLAPSIVPHTQAIVVPMLMQRRHPSKAAPMRTWWRLEETTNEGQTWQALPTTPHPILPAPPSLIFQAWNTSQDGWVVLGSHLYRTTDGGHQWAASSLPTGTVVNLSRVSATDAHTAIYRTDDGGVNWHRVS